jgi:hypothetical protein
MARRKLTEDEQLAAVAKLHRISGPEARQAQADRAGLTKDQQAELAEAVGFEGDLYRK